MSKRELAILMGILLFVIVSYTVGFSVGKTSQGHSLTANELNNDRLTAFKEFARYVDVDGKRAWWLWATSTQRKAFAENNAASIGKGWTEILDILDSKEFTIRRKPVSN